jgi:hypothetical protein
MRKIAYAMKLRIAVFGCVMVALLAGIFVFAATQSNRVSIEELQSYLESVPASYGWKIVSRSGWEPEMHNRHVATRTMKKRWFENLLWNESDASVGDYTFRKGRNDIHVIAYFRKDCIRRVKIYAGLALPIDISMALELKRDLRKRYPYLKVDSYPK